MRMLMVAGAMLAATPATAQTQAAMNAEAGAAYKRADAAMSAAWRVAYAGMKARDAADRSRGGGFGYAAALLESQRAWLKFRDVECVIEGGQYAGGSLQAMTATQCRTRLTTTRLQELRAFRWSR